MRNNTERHLASPNPPHQRGKQLITDASGAKVCHLIVELNNMLKPYTGPNVPRFTSQFQTRCQQYPRRQRKHWHSVNTPNRSSDISRPRFNRNWDLVFSHGPPKEKGDPSLADSRRATETGHVRRTSRDRPTRRILENYHGEFTLWRSYVL